MPACAHTHTLASTLSHSLPLHHNFIFTYCPYFAFLQSCSSLYTLATLSISLLPFCSLPSYWSSLGNYRWHFSLCLLTEITILSVSLANGKGKKMPTGCRGIRMKAKVEHVPLSHSHIPISPFGPPGTRSWCRSYQSERKKECSIMHFCPDSYLLPSGYSNQEHLCVRTAFASAWTWIQDSG